MLATADCDTEKKFLCDVRKKGTGGLAMQQECLEIWNVSTSDIDYLQKVGVTSANYTYQLNCFLKCMGEYAGLFASGGMVTGIIIKAIEEAAMNDQKQLQNGFINFDECNSLKQDDDCITAGEVYSCGRQKEPTLVDSIFNSEKGNATVIDPPVACSAYPRKCVYEGNKPCVTNDALRSEYLSTGSTSIGNKSTSAKKGSFFRSIDLPTPLNLSFSYYYCCSLGMRLMEIKAAEYQEFISFLGYAKFVIIGETYQVNGTNQNAYCRSNHLISDVDCYKKQCVAPVCEGESDIRLHGGSKSSVNVFLCENP